MRRALLFLAIAASACALPHVSKQKPPFSDDGGDRELPQGMAVTEKGLSQKAVNGKEEPATLMSADRQSCIVTAKKFRETAIGDKVWCAWH